MGKLPRIILVSLLVSALLLLLSPVISLLLPEKLTKHTYYRLFYNLIVENETAGSRNNAEKALKLFRYVVSHEFAQGAPDKCKPLESLIQAEAYCDFQARTLNALLGIARIPSRYAMLLDKDGISPHTLNEVLLDDKWSTFDTLTNIVFRDGRGRRLTLEELSDNPKLIFAQEKIAALKEYNVNEFESFFAWQSRMFPMPQEPRRSTPYMFQSHLLDYIADAYFKIFKSNFFNLYQDLYLKTRKSPSADDDAGLFFRARNYHLAYRKARALNSYNVLLEEYPESAYVEDAAFFRGVLYYEMEDFPKAVESFNLIVNRYSPKWRAAASYYLGMGYDLMGEKDRSLVVLSNASIYKLSTQTIEKLSKKGSQNNELVMGDFKKESFK